MNGKLLVLTVLFTALLLGACQPAAQTATPTAAVPVEAPTETAAITLTDGRGVEITLTEPAEFDLASVVTHEAGHFLGLSHSCAPGATMIDGYMTGDLGMRSIEADDIAGICAIYPPTSHPPACDPTPPRGFSKTCGGASDDGCGCNVIGSEREAGSLPALALAALLLRLRRRRTAH